MCVRAIGHCNKYGAVVVVLGIDAVYGLLKAQTVLVVGIRDCVSAIRIGNKLLSLPCKRLAKVACRVAHGVVRDGLIIERGKTIAPLAVVVAIYNGLRNSTESIGCIGILTLVKDIAPVIVLIGIGRIVGVSGAVIQVLPYELVGFIILIGEACRALFCCQDTPK